MDLIREKTRELIAAVAESNEYRRYQSARAWMNSCPPLKAQVDIFRECNLKMQTESEDIFESTRLLEQEFEDLLKEPAVQEYLNAEYDFCRLVQQINWELIESLDFEAEIRESNKE